MATTIAILAAEEGEYNPLLPATYDIVWSAVCIAVIGFVFWKYILPKFQAVMAERSELIEGGIKRAEEAQAEAKAALEQYQKQRRSVRKRERRVRRSSPK